MPIRHNGKLGEEKREVIEEKKETSVDATDEEKTKDKVKTVYYNNLLPINKELMMQDCFLKFKKDRTKYIHTDLLIDDLLLPSDSASTSVSGSASAGLATEPAMVSSTPPAAAASASASLDDTKLKSLVNYCFLRLLFIHYCCHSYVALFDDSDRDVLYMMRDNPETKPVFLFNLYSEPTFVNLNHRINCDKSFIKDIILLY